MFTHARTHVRTHTYTHTHYLPNLFHCYLTISGHSQTFRIPVPIELNFVLNSCDTLQANASVCDTYLRLADFQDLGANRVKPCFYLLGPTQNHSISLRPFLDILRLPGFRCQYSLTCFTTCKECSNETLILTYTHIYILTCIQTDRETDRQTDRQTYIHTLI